MSHSTSSSKKQTWILALGALGVVFGDIGTSPLYALRECVAHSKGFSPDIGILGSLSLIFWSLLLVVSVKYLTFVTKADNQGEGGIFALLALTEPKTGARKLTPLIILILVGAALLYGDGVITPAISVLGAVEGLKAISPDFEHWIVPLSCVILVVLFAFQSRGTGTIGAWFGPIMLVWFVAIGVLGLIQIVQSPGILLAANPWYGLQLLIHEPAEALVILGSVVLAITGGEALYADLGHFGRPPMERAWYGLVLPGLLLNYFGQGALALRRPEAVENLFFEMAPEGPWRALLLGLSIAASVIASQALISGCYSLSHQAMQLGYLPRMVVRHTSSDQEGQIYVPTINWLLLIGCLLVVLMFQGSDRLAAAYGIAVTGTMGITTVAYYVVTRKLWHWSFAKAGLICGAFLIIDVLFFASNLRKILEGGWFPLVVAGALMAVMLTWKRGRAEIGAQLRKQMVEPELIVSEIEAGLVLRVPGTAVFMTANPTGTPVSLLHHLKANKCLHQNAVLLTFIVEHVPRVEKDGHLQVQPLGGGLVRVVVRYGYMENPDAPALVHLLNDHNIKVDLRSTFYYFNQEMIVCTGKAPMPMWQKQLYRILSRNANAARDYFGIPPNQIVEMGLPIVL